jgi:histidinol-phosphate aminotransferase
MSPDAGPDVSRDGAKGPYRRGYRDLRPFAGSGGSPSVGGAADLSDNTNLWGPPPAAARAAAAAMSAARSYPHPHADPLVMAVAHHTGVTPDMVVAGCGSDDVLDSAIRALVEPGGRVAAPDPTFPMAAVFARTNGLTPIGVPLGQDWHIDVDGLLATGAPVIYVASPNNPTGVASTRQALERLIARAPGFVILDQAYVEFTGDDDATLAFLRASDRLLVIRTLSKAWGLAGLRVGYGLGASHLVAEVAKARGPYKVNVVAEQAAIAALRDDAEWVKARVDEVIENRSRLTDELRSFGLRPLPSDANFLLVPIPPAGGGADRLVAALRAQDIIVRQFTAVPGIGDAIRITIGPWPIMERLLSVVGQTLASLGTPPGIGAAP